MPSLRIPSLLATVVRGSQEMVLFYRGPEARITDTVFESLSPIHQVYPINELQSVHTPRQDVIEQVTSSGPVRVCSTGMAGLSVLVATAGWPILDHPRLRGGDARVRGHHGRPRSVGRLVITLSRFVAHPDASARVARHLPRAPGVPIPQS